MAFSNAVISSIATIDFYSFVTFEDTVISEYRVYRDFTIVEPFTVTITSSGYLYIGHLTVPTEMIVEGVLHVDPENGASVIGGEGVGVFKQPNKTDAVSGIEYLTYKNFRNVSTQNIDMGDLTGSKADGVFKKPTVKKYIAE